ncbi:MAG TPA: hypothetical protein VKV02_08660, partial [Acidobacteriaceae bacterium]|nr:hypothetical protein [Acidobacteriaceae bacterium]
MRIAIDNEDGRGAVDYSAVVAADSPITIQRGLNVPSRCTTELAVEAGGSLATPARRGYVVITNDAGA